MTSKQPKSHVQQPSPPALFRVGDRVSYEFGQGRLHGVIAEVRGRLGKEGMQFYGVRIDSEPWNTSIVDLPEKWLQRETEAEVSSNGPPAK